MDQLIGNTPLLRLGNNIYAKAEFVNLTGSVKDRAAKYILEDAEEKDLLTPSGTITGTARFLKEKAPAIHVVAVEPAKSPLLSAGKAGSHGIQGIGANFIPQVLDRSLLDEVVTVTDEEAFAAA